MNLYILRHGIAVDHGTGEYKDSERPLTEEGIDKMKKTAKAMEKLDLNFDAILSSPFIRARQTAEIVAAKLNLQDKLELTDSLASGKTGKPLIEELQTEYKNDQKILLVGHEPDLSLLISKLTSGNDSVGLILKKGGLAKLSIEDLRYGRCAVLCWLLTPRLLLNIA